MEKFVTYGGEVDSPSPINFPKRVSQKMRESGTDYTIGLEMSDGISVGPLTEEEVFEKVVQLATELEQVSDPEDLDGGSFAIAVILFAILVAIGLEITKTKIPWYFLYQISN